MDNELYSVIIYGNEKIDYIIKNQENIDKIYTLTPKAKVLISNKINKLIIDHFNIYGEFSEKKNIVKVYDLQKKFFKKLNFDKNIYNPTLETFYNLFNFHISSIFFIALSLNNIYLKNKTLCVYDGNKWIITKNKSLVLKSLYFNINNYKQGFFKAVSKYNYFSNLIIKIINLLIFSLIKKRKIFWTAGTSSGLKNLKKQLFNANKRYLFLSTSNRSRLKIRLSISNLIKIIFNLKNIHNLEIAIISSKSNSSYDLINKTLLYINDPTINVIRHEISIFFSTYCDYTESIKNYTESIVKKSKPNCLLADEIRWFNSCVIANSFKKINKKIYLISHGSHTPPNDIFSKIAFEFHCRGLLYSQYATSVVLQSPSAKVYFINKRDKPLDEFCHIDSETEIIESQPVIWGDKTHYMKKDTKKNVILHAGTYKTTGGRPYIHETSNSYVASLINLINALDKIPNTKLIIRYRESLECSYKNLLDLLPLSNNYEVKLVNKKLGSINEDLAKSDLLITYSSTTSEEALYNFTPVGLFGLNENFKFIKGTNIPPSKNQRNAVYYLNKNNLVSMIKNIIKFHKNNQLTHSEVKNYIWDEKVKEFSNYIYERY